MEEVCWWRPHSRCGFGINRHHQGILLSCLAPSADLSSLPCVINNLAGCWYLLVAYVEMGGHKTLILWRTATLFNTLKAFETSIRSMASISSSWMHCMDSSLAPMAKACAHLQWSTSVENIFLGNLHDTLSNHPSNNFTHTKRVHCAFALVQ